MVMRIARFLTFWSRTERQALAKAVEMRFVSRERERERVRNRECFGKS